jgi:alpha-L-rhamnosidase
MRIANMRTNHIVEPIGFITDYITFSWTVEDAGNAKKQQAARIKVWEKVAQGDPVYDSGIDQHANSVDYPVEIKLQPRTRYYWEVTVFGDNGEQAVGMSWFETGKKR